MTFENLGERELKVVQERVHSRVAEEGLQLTELQVAIKDYELLLISAEVRVDPILASPSGEMFHRRVRFETTMFTVSPETDREVIGAIACFSVPSQHSNFFPVQDEYGEDVSIKFTWEFDCETLRHGACEVRDRTSVHYVSVSPSDQLLLFVQCCSEVAEDWGE